jgi:hypothetical protein
MTTIRRDIFKGLYVFNCLICGRIISIPEDQIKVAQKNNYVCETCAELKVRLGFFFRQCIECDQPLVTNSELPECEKCLKLKKKKQCESCKKIFFGKDYEGECEACFFGFPNMDRGEHCGKCFEKLENEKK